MPRVRASDLKVGDHVLEENVFDARLDQYVGQKIREVVQLNPMQEGRTIDVHFADGGGSLVNPAYEFNKVDRTFTNYLNWDDGTESPLQVSGASYNDAGEVTLLIYIPQTTTYIRVLLVKNDLSESLRQQIKNL